LEIKQLEEKKSLKLTNC